MDVSRITVDPDVMSGLPTVRGLRIPVATIAAMAADGMSIREILTDLPDLELGDVSEALRYTANTVRRRIDRLVDEDATTKGP